MFKELKKKLSVIGLGYVGLALAMAYHFKVIGYVINEGRIVLMKQGVDPSREIEPADFKEKAIDFGADAADLRKAHFHIITVPTLIDEHGDV